MMLSKEMLKTLRLKRLRKLFILMRLVMIKLIMKRKSLGEKAQNVVSFKDTFKQLNKILKMKQRIMTMKRSVLFKIQLMGSSKRLSK